MDTPADFALSLEVPSAPSWSAHAARRERRSSAVRGREAAGRHDPASGDLPNAELVAAFPRLRRYAQVLTGDGNRADDLVQDTLARAWEKRNLWLAGSNLRAWLFTIMHNIHINQFARRRCEMAETSLDGDNGGTPGRELAEDGAAVGWEIPVRATQSDRLELAEVLMHIERLPAEQREVLILAAVEELRYEEIAQVQGIPIGTVMSRLNRGREKLRRLLATAPAPLKRVK